MLSPRIVVHSYLHFTLLIGVCRLSSLRKASEGERKIEREKETREDEDVMDDEVEGREEEEENGDSRRHNLYDEGQSFDVINGWSHCCC